MEYRAFTIRNYRALKGPLTIDVAKRPLLPIIGINESGKTTVLHAIFAFDHYNDGLNGGRHLEDTHNLWSTGKVAATVEAELRFDPEDWAGVLLNDLEAESNPRSDPSFARSGRSARSYPRC